jgi:osmoprotectant transport system substrate-binding protein
VRFRKQTIGLVVKRWPALTATTVASHLALWLVLLLSLRHVGVSEQEVSTLQVLAVFAFSRLLSAVPITPGGVGVVELSLIGGIYAAGRSHADVPLDLFKAQVTAAALLFRALTYGIQIPIGDGPRGAPDVSTLRRHPAPSAVFVVLLLTGCITSTSPQHSDPPGVIRVAAFGFTESEILAELYVQALRADGYPTGRVVQAGPRELVQPALAEGLIDLVPEYAGSALSFLTLGTDHGSADIAETHDALTTVLAPLGIVALQPAPAQDSNAIVVTQETADRFGLHDISDVRSVAAQLVFGGPPECANRRLCLKGLETVYGLRFQAFIPLDSGGPLTLQALRSGGIDVALLFTTDPAIASEGLVVLSDDRELQPSENVTPLLRREVLLTHGSGVVHTLDALSALLTTSDLRAMIGRVVGGSSARAVAKSWLQDHRSMMEAP